METEIALQPAADGMFHPADEAEVAELVRFARAHGRRLRVRGAGHSPGESFAGDNAGDLVLLLDRMHALTVLDQSERLVEAQAGIHLGGDPSSPGEDGAARNSLLHQLANRFGWTVGSTGGITHQTVGGFLGSCSAGGSVQHSFLDHVVAVRVVDGCGEVREFRVGEADGLAPVLPSSGLLGVTVSVTLRCEPIFTITGQEAIVDIAGAPVDLEGPGDPSRPALADFFTRAEYARIEWWPQRGAERLLVWQAQRAALQPGFRPTRYEEFTRYPVLGEALFSTIFVIFGNLMAPPRVAQLLRRNATEVSRDLDELVAAGRVGRRARRLWSLLPAGIRMLAFAAPVLRLLRPVLVRSLPWMVPSALKLILPLDTHKPGMRHGEPQSFRDWGWEGLPMDNQASDVLLWTQFTELWVPLSRGSEMIRLLRSYFAGTRDARESFERTGLYAFELYAAKPAEGWLHPGHSDGIDEWAEGALRLDVYWFTDNLEDPRERFYPQFWNLLDEHGLAFRCHWGKELPGPTIDRPDTAARWEAVYPHWRDWLELRAEYDPDGVFLTDYWCERLGLVRP
jgi:hypothetical protein